MVTHISVSISNFGIICAHTVDYLFHHLNTHHQYCLIPKYIGPRVHLLVINRNCMILLSEGICVVLHFYVLQRNELSKILSVQTERR